MERIPQLPQPMLHDTLSLLPQKIEFLQSFYGGTFVSVFQNTLQWYVDQNLPIQEFILGMSRFDPQSISLLNKWIPIVLMNEGLKMFSLSAKDFPLPSVVFQAEVLEELFLFDCKLNQIPSSLGKVQLLKRLRLLSLGFVWIDDETFEKIMWSCPSIEYLVLDSCIGLRAIKVNKAPNLKHFDCYGFSGKDESIEINDAPFLETIIIKNCQFWHHHNNYFFPRLKSLFLWHVHLPTELLNNLSSNNCPCLEDLQLHFCYGFTEFKLSNLSIKRMVINIPNRPIKAEVDAANMVYFECKSSNPPISISFPRIKTLKLWDVHLPTMLLNNLSSSNCPCLVELELHRCSGIGEFKLWNRSIERLIINEPECPIKAAIDAANMLYFEYRGRYLPSISFATTSREWKSRIEVCGSSYSNAAWSLKMYEFLKALSRSQISLNISNLLLTNQDTYDGGSCEPVVVQDLCLNALQYSSSPLPELLNSVFQICRPRYIGLPFFANSQKEYERQIAESIWKILIKKGETRQCDFWQWHPDKVCEMSNSEYIWYRLNGEV